MEPVGIERITELVAGRVFGMVGVHEHVLYALTIRSCVRVDQHTRNGVRAAQLEAPRVIGRLILIPQQLRVGQHIDNRERTAELTYHTGLFKGIGLFCHKSLRLSLPVLFTS